MQYQIYNLNFQKRDSVVEITLTAAANVRMMDAMNYDLFKNKQQHKYFGGFVTVSPYRMAIPWDGHWVVLIDASSDPNFKPSVKVLARNLPGAR